MYFSSLCCVLLAQPSKLFLPDLIALIFDEEYKPRSSSLCNFLLIPLTFSYV
jgi:hypothetical protein